MASLNLRFQKTTKLYSTDVVKTWRAQILTGLRNKNAKIVLKNLQRNLKEM